MSKYYLAYGSNLNLEHINNLCPGIKKVGSMMLQGYELEFKKYLTIKENKECSIPVGIFEVNDYEEKRIDRYENYPVLYRKENILINVNGVPSYGFIYIMNENTYDITPPSNDYLQRVIKGYSDFGFDQKYIIDALNKTYK